MSESNQRHDFKDTKSGKFSRKRPWDKPGHEGFWNWFDSNPTCVLHSDGKYRPIVFEQWQVDVINQMLELSPDGRRKYSFCLSCWPKRHSKSIINADLVLKDFTTRENWLCVCLANNLNQALSVNFRLLQDIILNTPSLKRLIGEKNVLANEIRFPKNNNRIVAMANNISGAHGLKLSCLWCTELWTSPDLKAFRALFASLADTQDSVCYLDTNTDFHGGVIHEFEEEAKKDPSMFAHRIEYKDYEDFDKKAPHWISRSAVRVSRKIDLDQDFARNWLNKRSASKSQLFPDAYVKAAKSPYKAPADLESIVLGRKYFVTGGLDRAKNLLPGISNSDFSVWVCLLKVADPASAEPHYHILNMVRFDINTDKNIKKAILEDHKRYGLSNVCLEFYEVSSISAFLSENHIEHELQSATDSYQNASFPEMHRIFRDGRFHFPENIPHFESELKTFSITQKKSGTYSFSHSSQKFHDDTVHATNLAIWAGRKTVLNVFELPTIQCRNKSPRKSHCYLMGGNFVLGCSMNCPAHEQVETMYRTFIALQTETELSIVDFFKAHVKTSVRVSQAA
jgi:hypothetical protein